MMKLANGSRLAAKIGTALLCLLITTEFSSGLRDVRITIPIAVKKGDSANLICNYDMEGDTLYSVKWYKGRREFYRYTPKENPAIKMFTQPGIRVEPNLSNGSNIVLLSVDTQLSGKFSCEVSADAPSFHTTIVSGDMEVVETPEQRPTISGIQSRYRIGDIIKGNCSSLNSKPAANLTWTINDIPVPKLNTIVYSPAKNTNNNLETSTIGIYFLISHSTFIRGKIKLRCFAQLYNIHKTYTDKIIEEVIPRILATGTSGHNNANLLQNSPYDESSTNHQTELLDENGLPQRDDSFLKQYKDLSSSSPPPPASALVANNPLASALAAAAALIISSTLSQRRLPLS